MPDNTLIRDLGDGLVLRQVRREEADAMADLNSGVFRNPDTGEPHLPSGVWVHDLITRPHPTVTLDDYTVVEDTKTGALVSSMVLISQTWSYDGIEVAVGRPEAVATRPEYRRRGLVRAQFEVAHQRSAEKGELCQAITGIPNFYRQFGYEMTVELDGWRSGALGNIPKLKEGQEEPFVVRPAREADIPFLVQVYAGGQERWLLSCVRDEATWRLELSGRSDGSDDARLVRVIETPTGAPVGLLVHPNRLWGTDLRLIAYGLRPGVSWLAVTPTVLRYLKLTGEAMAAADPKKQFHTVTFGLGDQHPGCRAARRRLPATGAPYSWYMRVPDLPRFLRHIRPVLERRLAESIAVGHTGELKVSFYRTGLKLAFREGRLETVEPWQPASSEDGDAGFPGLTFLHLLFGHRSTEELRQTYADCGVWSDAASVLLPALFPKKASCVWPLA